MPTPGSATVRAVPALLDRVLAALASRRGYVAMMAVWMPTALLADARGPRAAQAVVAVVTWLILGLVALAVPRAERLQLGVVVLVATCLEISFSIIWGLYIYRWHNLPLYVPPGHGLVYMLALRLSETGWARHRRAPLAVIVAAGGWTAWNLAVPAVRDDVGMVLLPVLAAFLLRGARPPVYVGAFVATTALELLGTGFGNWAWQAHVPGLPMGQANPPSAIAGGYCILDAVTLVICARLAVWRPSLRPAADPATGD